MAWQEWCEERERRKAREGTKVNNFSTFLMLTFCKKIQVFSISDNSVFDPRHQSPTDLTNKSAKPKRKKKKSRNSNSVCCSEQIIDESIGLERSEILVITPDA